MDQNINTSYCLAQDLLVLAAKTYINGNTKGAAKLFASACSSKDLPLFVNRAIFTEGAKNLDIPTIKRRTLATVQAAFDELSGPISPEDLRKILSTIKSKRTVQSSADPDEAFTVTTPDDEEDAEDFDEEYSAVVASTEMDGAGDEDFSLDADDEDADSAEDELDVCPECESDPCSCDFEADGTQEETLARANEGLYESVKNSLVSLKVRSNDWEVKEFIPTLIQFFPDLARTANVTTKDLVNQILNRLHTISSQEIQQLNRMLIPLREG